MSDCVFEILGNVCITIVCSPGCDVINFENNRVRFATKQKSQEKKLNILRTKRVFKVKQKAFFIIFKGLSVAKNCLRPEGAPLKVSGIFYHWSKFKLGSRDIIF